MALRLHLGFCGILSLDGVVSKATFVASKRGLKRPEWM